MTYKYRVYMHGAIAGFITGVSNGFFVCVIDPKTFNLFDGGAAKLTLAVLLFGLSGAFAYTKDHPLPDPDKDIDAVSASKGKIAEITKAME